MSTEDVSDFLTRVLREQDFDFHNLEEVIYWYCYRNHLGYYKAEEYKETYKQMTPVEKKTGEIVYGTGLCLDSEEKLLEYLAFLKGRHDDPKSEKSQAFQEFMILLERARKIIAAIHDLSGLFFHRSHLFVGFFIFLRFIIAKMIPVTIPVDHFFQIMKIKILLTKHPGQKI